MAGGKREGREGGHTHTRSESRVTETLIVVGGLPPQFWKKVAQTSDAHTCEPNWNAVSVVPPARAEGARGGALA